MSYRCLMIVNPARIRCKNEQLLIETEEVHSVPIEDISAIVLESPKARSQQRLWRRWHKTVW